MNKQGKSDSSEDGTSENSDLDIEPSININSKKNIDILSQKHLKPNLELNERISKDCHDSQIGFSNLPKQLYRRALKRGFEFVLLVVGETGLGKSTLINSMFLTDIKEKELLKMERTVEVRTHQVLLEEGGVKLSLTVVDTPGYGDAVDNTDCWEPAVEYVEKQFDNYLEAETRVKREVLPDSRVHACLYFIAPSSHGLKIIDVEFMKSIDDKVNIIPVIAKADTLTSQEVRDLKIKVGMNRSTLT